MPMVPGSPRDRQEALGCHAPEPQPATAPACFAELHLEDGFPWYEDDSVPPTERTTPSRLIASSMPLALGEGELAVPSATATYSPRPVVLPRCLVFRRRDSRISPGMLVFVCVACCLSSLTSVTVLPSVVCGHLTPTLRGFPPPPYPQDGVQPLEAILVPLYGSPGAPRCCCGDHPVVPRKEA